MEFTPFLLNNWLSHYHFAEKPIEFDLASSTGPGWTFRQLLELLDPDQKSHLQSSELGYTPGPGTAALREAIAGMHGVQPAEVQVTTGASEALLLLFFRAARPGANIVVPSPGYPAFTEIPRTLGIEVRGYSLRPENNYRIDLDEIHRQTDGQTALVVVNSPQNPTGATLSDDDLRARDGFAAERGVHLVVDEVYHPIYHGRETDSAATLPHTTVIGDFSKAFCLPGLRTGWIVDHDPARRKEYLQARSYFTVCNTVVGEALAVAAVRHREKIFAESPTPTSPCSTSSFRNFPT
jgi:aspartate/methionine/tyrosine aminotransferase